MRRHTKARARIPVALFALCLLLPVGALAEGFGSPTIDGVLSAGEMSIYNAAEATDTNGDPPQGNTNMDLGTLYVANDATYWYFLFTINADVGATNWGKYMLFVDTTNDGSGAPEDTSSGDWKRGIVFNSPHFPEYSVRSWVDNLPYGASDTQFWSWNGSAWVNSGAVDDGALVSGSTSTIEWKIARAKLGDPTTIWCEVVSTGGNVGDPAQDTINDPAEDWNATDWTTVADIDVSTQVARQSGTDTTPPIVADGKVAFFLGSPAVTNRFDVTFSEPVDPTTAGNTANYTDLGGKAVNSAVQTGPSTVRLTMSANYGFGSCQQIKVTGVKDAAGNTIVDDGTTNVSNFYLYQIQMNAHMGIHMAADPDTGNGHSFGWEGGIDPLTWDPLCDLPLSDVDADSIWTETLNFCLPCSTGTGGAEVTQLQYKFTHGISGTCEHYESMGSNHYYDFDLTANPSGVDAPNIFWNDEAPSNFTDKAIDVLFRVQPPAVPRLGAPDSFAVAGSESPLTWNTAPPDQPMADDGVLPDSTAGDGVYSARLTFPMGSLKDVQFKYLLKAVADTVFEYECQGGNPGGEGNRNVFLNDSLFSTTTPIILDIGYFNDCLGVTGVEDVVAAITGELLEASRPNPLRTSALISYSLPAAAPVKLDVYDVRGRHVRTLVDEIRPAGRHTVAWNGRLENGAPLPNGVYFYRLRAADAVETRKILLMR